MRARRGRERARGGAGARAPGLADPSGTEGGGRTAARTRVCGHRGTRGYKTRHTRIAGVHAHASTHTHTCAHAHGRACMHTPAHIHARTYTHAHANVHMLTCTHAHIHVHAHRCVHIHAPTHPHQLSIAHPPPPAAGNTHAADHALHTHTHTRHFTHWYCALHIPTTCTLRAHAAPRTDAQHARLLLATCFARVLVLLRVGQGQRGLCSLRERACVHTRVCVCVCAWPESPAEPTAQHLALQPGAVCFSPGQGPDPEPVPGPLSLPPSVHHAAGPGQATTLRPCPSQLRPFSSCHSKLSPRPAYCQASRTGRLPDAGSCRHPELGCACRAGDTPLWHPLPHCPGQGSGPGGAAGMEMCTRVMSPGSPFAAAKLCFQKREKDVVWQRGGTCGSAPVQMPRPPCTAPHAVLQLDSSSPELPRTPAHHCSANSSWERQRGGRATSPQVSRGAMRCMTGRAQGARCARCAMGPMGHAWGIQGVRWAMGCMVGCTRAVWHARCATGCMWAVCCATGCMWRACCAVGCDCIQQRHQLRTLHCCNRHRQQQHFAGVANRVKGHPPSPAPAL